MKASEFWAGHEYAWIPNRGKGESFSFNVRRIKVSRIMKHREYGNRNATTTVQFELLDWDGNSNPEPDIRTANAREILAFWDDYWSEHEERLEKYVERKREEAEQVRRNQLNTAAIKAGLIEKGFDERMFTISHAVTIQRKEIMRWLGIDVAEGVTLD